MAAEKPGERQIKSRRSNDQGCKNEKLHQEARVHRECGVVIPQPAPHSHDARAQGGLSKGSQYLHRSHGPVAQTKNNEQCEEIKESRKSCGQRWAAVLHAFEEKLQ